MEFLNEFTVPLGVKETFALLGDLERVAQFLPGATLDRVDDGTCHGTLRAKVGPLTVVYDGIAEITERHTRVRRIVLDASGDEKRGPGSATATVTADLEAAARGSTRVTVATDMKITGKAAQFGQAVLADAGTAIIIDFAARLAASLAPGETEREPEPEQPEPEPEAMQREPEPEQPEPEPEAMQREPEPEQPEPEPEPEALPPLTETPAADAVVPAAPTGAGQEAVPAMADGPPVPPPAAPHRPAPARPVTAAPRSEHGDALANRAVPLAVAGAIALGVAWWWRRRGGASTARGD